MSLNLCVVIPTKNEAANLNQCLSSIGVDFAKKVVVVDSGSVDDTVKIAKQNHVEVIKFNWDGKYPKKRNWYLKNFTPNTEWVLFLDADECLTPEFKTEVSNILKSNTKHVGFWLSYSIFFMGKKLKGGYPMHKLALFKVGFGNYEKIEEYRWSNLDMEIHEHPVLNGSSGVIKSKIEHRDYRGVYKYVQKHSEYADWEAARYLKAINDPDYKQLKKTWVFRQRVKYTMMRSVLIGPVYFIGSYIFLAGFIDGSRGFAFAMMKMNYFNQIYCKIKENTNVVDRPVTLKEPEVKVRTILSPRNGIHNKVSMNS